MLQCNNVALDAFQYNVMHISIVLEDFPSSEKVK